MAGPRGSREEIASPGDSAPRCTEICPVTPPPLPPPPPQPGAQGTASLAWETDATLTSMPVTVYPLGFLLGFFLPSRRGVSYLKLLRGVGVVLGCLPFGGSWCQNQPLGKSEVKNSKPRWALSHPHGSGSRLHGTSRPQAVNAKVMSSWPASVRLHPTWGLVRQVEVSWLVLSSSDCGEGTGSCK